jgi:hypothetical protein
MYISLRDLHRAYVCREGCPIKGVMVTAFIVKILVCVTLAVYLLYASV